MAENAGQRLSVQNAGGAGPSPELQNWVKVLFGTWCRGGGGL